VAGARAEQRSGAATGVHGAAFFDLDRTLLRGASGEVFSDAMRAAGLVNRSIPGEKLLYSLFNTVGETLPSMALARQAVALAKGRSRASVLAASDAVADRLVDMLQPFARPVFEMHREAGRPIVLATTTPYDLVKPFADRLGLDDVIATRYGVRDDGDTYDGTLVGPFVWSAGKLEAVREWAGDHDIDLADSWFYSDSVYDTPLMSVIGNPVVVNPDPRMVLMAAARRWPTLHLDVSPGVVKLPVVGLELQKLAMAFSRPELVPYADISIKGVEHIPATGPVIVVANHRSYFDPTVMAMVFAKAGRTARFLGKKEVFDAPLLGAVAKALGGIRVDRGTGSDEPLQAAIEALEGGELVALMPQGTIPRGPAFFDPELKGRYGAARLAQLTGAPVIPVGLWGTEKVWPRRARVPKVFNIVDAPAVTAKVGKPVELKHKSLDADTRRIMKAIVKQLPADAKLKHEPTAEELAATYPSGYRGDPKRERARRPGAD
jgi:putative phosphoserine phosphatase / 1-acylglycerol-3-phosphate O-acyltransferase